MEVREKLYEFVKEAFGIGDDPDYTYDVHLFDEGFVDSLGATEIVLYIEKEFGVKITQKDITLYPMNTINEISEIVEQKLNEQ